MNENISFNEFKSPHFKRWIFILVFLTSAFIIWYFKPLLQTEITGFQIFINSNPIESAIFFVLAYSLIVPFSFPPIIMNAMGAFLFDFPTAVFLNISGALSSGIISFFYGKMFLKADDSDSFLDKIKLKFPFFNRELGWVEVMLVRSIMIPFTLVSYSSGIMGIKTGQYILGTLIGIIPGTAINTYFLGESVSLVLKGNYSDIHLWTSIGVSFFLIGSITLLRFLLISWYLKRKSSGNH